MRSLFFKRRLIGTMFAVAALSLALAPVHAQTLNVTSGTHTENTNTYQSGTINVFNSAILDVVPGGSVQDTYGYNTSTTNVTGGSVINTYGYDTSTANISSGSVINAAGYDTSTFNISGGNLVNADSLDTSTVNLSGGDVINASGYDDGTINISGGSIHNIANGDGNSTFNISGGSIAYAGGFGTNTFNISGGTLTNGLLLYHAGATANFIGTDLSFAYQSYGNTSPYGSGFYVDFFKVSGTIGGAATTYDLYIRNDDGSSGPGTPNSAARQFLFNGLAPVVVPEAGTFAQMLPALGLLGIALAKRRHAPK